MTYQALDNTGALQLVGQVVGEHQREDGTVIANYSFDSMETAFVGLEMNKTLASSSEAASTGSNVLIGEELTYDVDVRWFGLIVGEDVSAISIIDQVPDATAAASATNSGVVDL